MMYGDGWGWGLGGWLMMTVVMVLFWAVVITAVVVGIRYLTSPRHTTTHPVSPAPPRAADLLAGRFARGEIDDDEYRRRHALLREHR